MAYRGAVAVPAETLRDVAHGRLTPIAARSSARRSRSPGSSATTSPTPRSRSTRRSTTTAGSRPNPNGYANDCEIHSRFETAFVSHAITREDVFPRLAAPELTSDYFATGLSLIKDSNSIVERLYAMDRDGGFDVLRPVKPEAKEFVVARLAKGASVLRDLWWSAWKNSAQQPQRRRR